MRLEDFRIDVVRLSRPELSALSGVSVSSIKRAEEGQKVDRLTYFGRIEPTSRQNSYTR